MSNNGSGGILNKLFGKSNPRSPTQPNLPVIEVDPYEVESAPQARDYYYNPNIPPGETSTPVTDESRTPRPSSPVLRDYDEGAAGSSNGRYRTDSSRRRGHRHRTSTSPDEDGYLGGTGPVRNRSLLRRGPTEEDFKSTMKPIVRVTLKPHTPDINGFKFPPISFELYDDGPSVPICRLENRSAGGAVVFSKGKVRFGSRVITRRSHAQIWCDNSKVFIQDTGSSAGTFLNEERMVHEAATVSPPYELNSGDLVRFGQNYKSGPLGDPMFKCVSTKVAIEYLALGVIFDCRPHCKCAWRELLDRKLIYSIFLPVEGAVTIFTAIQEYTLRSNIMNDPWQGWNEQDAVLFITVLENIIAAYKGSEGEEVMSCRSWIRKIVRQTGVLPNSFVLRGVQKMGDHPVSGGGFADIYMGMHERQEVALKVLRVFVTEKNRKEIHREVAHEALFWKDLRHPHILPFLGITYDIFTPRLSLVSPWMPNGNVLNYIEKTPSADRLALLSQCARGLRYLHNHNPALVHGDVKGANILVDANGTIRLTDFGLLTISESQSFATSYTSQNDKGSLRWMAPELFKTGVKKSRSSDVYAFGMTILEIYTGRPPFQGYNHDMQVAMATSRGERPVRPNPDCGLYEELWRLASLCWGHEQDSRPDITKVTGELDNILVKRSEGELTPFQKLDGDCTVDCNTSDTVASLNFSTLSLDSQDTQVTLMP